VRPLSRARAPTLAIALITVLAAALRLISLADVPGNPYYDAAVRSMALSWHNFFFAAFEPSAHLGLDKPPVDAWFQVLSVKAFGYHSFALKLPEALGGAAAVPLLYDLVRRMFGTGAGLASALALAVLPISVLTSRSDTMDSLMMALIVLAGWLVVRAAQTGRSGYLFGAAAVLGIDFNVKLFEALVPLPAFALLYLIASPLPIRRRVRQGALALLVLAAVSLSWSIAVSLAPARDRPYAIGSTNGSVWNAAFVFNGVHRLKHASAGSAPAGPSSGSPSPTRLLGRTGPSLGKHIGAELFPALVFGGLALGLVLAAGDRSDRLRFGGAVAIAVWLAIGFIGFSGMSRLEWRYLEAFTPAIAAALGTGVVTLATAVGRRASRAFVAGSAVTIAYTLFLARGTPAVLVVIVVAGIVAVAVRRKELLAPLLLVALLAVPASDSLAFARHHTYDSSSGGGFLSARQASTLSRYLTTHQGSARYEAAVLSVWEAASLVVLDRRPVLVTRNVDGSPLLKVTDLENATRSGELRYVVAGTPCLHPARPTRCPPAARWAQLHGTLVPGVVPHLGLYRVGR
jgi:4-amino-4-deoxy-L-arabinose transferase-like glycosyltransferase